MVVQQLPQFLRAPRGGFHGADEHVAQGVLFQLMNGSDGRSARGGDSIAQHDRMLAGFFHQSGRAQNGLHRQARGNVPRQAHLSPPSISASVTM